MLNFDDEEELGGHDALISVSQDGFHINSPEIAKKLSRKNLSPSLVTGLDKCPASWLGDTFVMRDLLPEEPDNAARRGTLFHKVMEDFFALPAEERTKEAVNRVLNDVIESDEFKDMQAYPEAMEWLIDAVHNYYKMGATPQNVKVADVTSKDGKREKGLEVFVKGRIGNTKREILGFIDRLVIDPKFDDPDKVVIEDWKSGGKIKRWNPNTKNDDGLPEARQQLIYAELLEKNYGKTVTGARLIFPMAEEVDKKTKKVTRGGVINVPVDDENLRKRVVADVEEADAKLTFMEERNVFEYKPSVLCAWCPLAKICPSAKIIATSPKVVAAYESQPSPELLMEAFEIV